MIKEDYNLRWLHNICFIFYAHIMAEKTTTPNIPTTKQAAEKATQAVNQVADQVQAQAQKVANTAKELASDPTKVVGLV
jgi:hypothetical protein